MNTSAIAHAILEYFHKKKISVADKNLVQFFIRTQHKDGRMYKKVVCIIHKRGKKKREKKLGIYAKQRQTINIWIGIFFLPSLGPRRINRFNNM